VAQGVGPEFKPSTTKQNKTKQSKTKLKSSQKLWAKVPFRF
jgi:hypothetical protein